MFFTLNIWRWSSLLWRHVSPANLFSIHKTRISYEATATAAWLAMKTRISHICSFIFEATKKHPQRLFSPLPACVNSPRFSPPRAGVPARRRCSRAGVHLPRFLPAPTPSPLRKVQCRQKQWYILNCCKIELASCHNLVKCLWVWCHISNLRKLTLSIKKLWKNPS